MEPLAIPLGNQKTFAKWLVISGSLPPACVVGASAPYNHGVPLAGAAGERDRDSLREHYDNKAVLDMTVKCNGHIYLFEFKVVETAPKGRAMQQLKDKAYADKYRAEGLPIHLIGVEFSREQRNVVGFEIEAG